MTALVMLASMLTGNASFTELQEGTFLKETKRK